MYMGKKIILGVVLGIIIVGALLIFNNSGGKTTGYSISEGKVENLHEVSLSIEDMYCDSCAYGVKAQIEELEGVVSADIDAWEGTGRVLYDANRVSVEEIIAASTLYPASVVEDKEID
jgi:copper chaperone CopZ